MKNNVKHFRPAFTMIEVSVALIILSMLTATVLTVVNRAIDTVVLWRMKTEAFEISRENMEQMLSQTALSDTLEYGVSETNPDITWEKKIETFYEPTTNRMWSRAVSTAEFATPDGETEKVELTQWLVGLSKSQTMKVLKQKEALEKYQQELIDSGQEIPQELAEALGLDEQDDSQQEEAAEPADEDNNTDDNNNNNSQPNDEDYYLNKLLGNPPEGYDSWNNVPDNVFWPAVMEKLFKK